MAEVTIVKKVTALSEEIIVVSDFLPYPLPGIRLVADIYPGCGPLGGIHVGLTAASKFHSLIVACDMPFLNLELLRYMVQLATSYDVVIPCWDDQLELMHAIYSKNCLGPIERLIQQQDFKIIHFFPEVRVRHVERDEIERFDPEHLSFSNINTPEDWRQTQRWVREKELGHAFRCS